MGSGSTIENSDKDEDEEDEEEYWMVCCSSRVFDEEGMLDGLLAENEEHFICFAKAKDAYDNFVKYEENNLNDMTCNPMREPICAEIALWSSKDYHTGKEELERWYYDFEEEETSQGHNFKEQELYKEEGLNITSEAAKLANQWQLDADDIAEEVKPTGADNTIRRNDLKEIVKAAIKAWDEEVFSDEDDEDEDNTDEGAYECGCYYKAAAGGFCGQRFVDKYGCTTESRILYSGEWESDCDEHYQSEERYVCINCADEWKEALGMYEDGDEQYYKANAPQDLTACEMNKAWQSAHNTKRNMPVGDVINEFLDFLCEIPQEERCVSKNLHEWQRKRTLMKLAFKQWVKKDE
jgi:hypothetical protein